MDTRYSFTAQFVLAAAAQAREAYLLEEINADVITEDERARHRGYVVGAIMQAVAALESEVWEVMAFGPGHHLGSGGIDTDALALLAPVAELIDRQDVLARYTTVLHLLGKRAIAAGGREFANAHLLVRLRNALVHYKSEWGRDMERKKLIASLESKRHRRPPFLPASGMNFFPHYCLSADCAAWAADSSVSFIESFYVRLGLPPRLAVYGDRVIGRRLAT